MFLGIVYHHNIGKGLDYRYKVIVKKDSVMIENVTNTRSQKMMMIQSSI